MGSTTQGEAMLTAEDVRALEALGWTNLSEARAARPRQLRSTLDSEENEVMPAQTELLENGTVVNLPADQAKLPSARERRVASTRRWKPPTSST